MLLSATPDEKILYNVATAHLDTQWQWTIQDSIDSYIPSTLDGNHALITNPSYPDYTFSFEGAYRYLLAKEYYPSKYSTLSADIANGHWAVAGSSVDAGDVNIPSTESLMRQILYGNEYFQQEFGKTSTDIFLPDCFGFGYALPSVAAHMGLKGFSTQKLDWGSAHGIPFDVGVWQGPDGASIMAALTPGSYGNGVPSNLDYDSAWASKIDNLGNLTTISSPYDQGAYVGYRYFGVGDTGGAPSASDVANLETNINNTDPNRLFGSVSASSDQIFRDLYAQLTPQQISQMPHYNGELVMTTHGTGSYTSQAAMKRWNRENELLADSAEKASVLADWLGGAAYPQDELTEAWMRFLEHQFHDDLTGTSIPNAYDFSWNDEVISLNQFSSILTNAVGATAQALNTQTVGQPVVVYNPVGAARSDLVEAQVRFDPGTNPAAARVYDDTGAEVPSQVTWISGDTVTVQFLADVPSIGYKVFDVQPTADGCLLNTGLSIQKSGTDYVLESNRYRVKVNVDNAGKPQGDVWSIWDKTAGRELLSAPARLQLLPDNSNNWPAWELLYSDVQSTPSYVDGPAEFSIVENGPAEVALQITRSKNGSQFIQTISLTPNGNQVVYDTLVDWQTGGTMLKAAFPLTVSRSFATYDLGLGTIQRGNNTSSLYEVPAQQWADITNTSSTYGVSILSDCKYGWDKPNNNTLRLTLLATPTATSSFSDQSTLDFGTHRMTYAICGHSGNWTATGGNTPGEAERLNQPLTAFQTVKHAGALGKSYSFISVSNPSVSVQAVKLTEDGSGKVILRLQEQSGAAVNNLLVSVGNGIASAREVNGSEQDLNAATVNGNGQLVVNMTAYQPRTFALVLAAPTTTVAPPAAQTVSLPFSTNPNALDVISYDTNPGNFSSGGMGNGYAISAELLPSTITVDDIPFQMGPKTTGAKNALACNGQTISLSPGGANRIYLLAAATGGRATGVFSLHTAAGSQDTTLSIEDYSEKVGRWGRSDRYDGTGFIHRDEIAWVGTHRHSSASAGTGVNNAYLFTDLFKYALDLPAGTTSITLPVNTNIRILAMTTAVNHNDDTTSACNLYDVLAPLQAIITSPTTGAALLVNTATTLQLESTAVDLDDASAPITQSWSVVSKPAGSTVTFGTPHAPNTTATFSANGTYVLKMTAVEDQTFASDQVIVVVGSLGSLTPDQGWWKFDEGSGTTAADSSSNGNTGTLDPHGRTTWTTGVSGSALYFNNSSSYAAYVQVNNASSLNPTSAITLSAWVKADTWNATPANNARIFQKGASDNQYRLLDENNLLKFDLTNVGTITAQLPSVGAWHFIVGTYAQGDRMRLYVDGIQVAESGVSSNTIATTGNPLFIGNKASTLPGGDYDDSLHGRIDDPRIYGRALSAGEIAALLVGMNTGPQVNAGSNQVVPGASADLSAAVIDDGKPSPPGAMTYEWIEVSGPGSASFTTPTTLATEVNVDQFGTYTFRLIANDSQAKTADDLVVQFLDNVPPRIDDYHRTLADQGGGLLQASFSATFSENVVVSQSNVTILDQGGYPVMLSSFNYSPANYQLTASVDNLTAGVTYTFSILDSVADAAGNHLDGEYDGHTLPTGDGTTGGTFANSFVATHAIIYGTPGNDVISLIQNAADPNLVDVYNQKGPTPNYSLPLSEINQLQILADAGDDQFTADFTRGNMLPAGGLVYQGGVHVAGDTFLVKSGSANDSVILTGTQISITGRPDISYAGVEFFGFDLGGGTNNLVVDHAPLRINQDNAISAATQVMIDGGTWDLNGYSDTIGTLTLLSGSILAGTITADTFAIESGTVTATLISPNSLIKSTTGEVDAASINAANISVNMGSLTASSLVAGSLTISAGTKLTIRPLSGGAQASAGSISSAPSPAAVGSNSTTTTPTAERNDNVASKATENGATVVSKRSGCEIAVPGTFPPTLVSFTTSTPIDRRQEPRITPLANPPASITAGMSSTMMTEFLRMPSAITREPASFSGNPVSLFGEKKDTSIQNVNNHEPQTSIFWQPDSDVIPTRCNDRALISIFNPEQNGMMDQPTIIAQPNSSTRSTQRKPSPAAATIAREKTLDLALQLILMDFHENNSRDRLDLDFFRRDSSTEQDLPFEKATTAVFSAFSSRDLVWSKNWYELENEVGEFLSGTDPRW